MHEIHQAHVAGACSADEGSDLQQYWDEIAREYVGSAGRCDSWARRLPSKSAYRSRYLDQLVQNFPDVENALGVKLLHPCAIKFSNQRLNDQTFATQIVAAIRGQKRTEIDQLGIHADGWSGRKKDLEPLLRACAERLGFVPERGGWLTRTKQPLRFRCRVDIGGSGELLPSLPLDFMVNHRADSDLAFVVSLDKVIPGLGHYLLFSTPEEAALGVYAQTTAFNLLAHTIAPQ